MLLDKGISSRTVDSDDKLGHEWVDRPPLRQNNHHSDTDKMTTTKNSLTSTKI